MIWPGATIVNCVAAPPAAGIRYRPKFEGPYTMNPFSDHTPPPVDGAAGDLGSPATGRDPFQLAIRKKSNGAAVRRPKRM